MKVLSYLTALIGVGLFILAVIGRFYGGEPTVLGNYVPGGVQASNLVRVGNTFLLLSILLFLYSTKKK